MSILYRAITPIQTNFSRINLIVWSLIASKKEVHTPIYQTGLWTSLLSHYFLFMPSSICQAGISYPNIELGTILVDFSWSSLAVPKEHQSFY